MKYVTMALERRAKRSIQEDESVLERFLAKNPNPKQAVVMILDMLAAGIDTVSKNKSSNLKKKNNTVKYHVTDFLCIDQRSLPTFL
jgi:histidine ammonia-lyase